MLAAVRRILHFPGKLRLLPRSTASGRRGSSMIEFALMMPWYAFLFVGVYDFGFYSYGLIATQSAARVAALYCSGSSSLAANCSTQSCSYALDSLRNMPNVGTGVTTCASSPLVVTSSMVTSVDGANASSVAVAYTTPSLIPIPGLLPGAVTITRTVIMKVQT